MFIRRNNIKDKPNHSLCEFKSITRQLFDSLDVIAYWRVFQSHSEQPLNTFSSSLDILFNFFKCNFVYLFSESGECDV